METLSKNKIKWISSLRLKKNRETERLFIVEGDKMVQEIVELWPQSIKLLCSTHEAYADCENSHIIDERDMKSISNLKTPASSLAVVKMPSLIATKKDLILAIDGVQDPGNMGTILRTADWFGVDEIICSKETVDIFNPKVIQSSMGSLFRIPVKYGNLATMMTEYKLPTFGALLDGENIYESDLPQKALIVMGNEGNGISSEIRKHIDHSLLIPQFGEAESLNVSIATGVILSEFKRSASH
mgnify:CR=1 FL=1